MNKKMILCFVAVVVVGVLAFFGGQSYAKKNNNDDFSGRANFNGQRSGQFGANMPNGARNGQGLNTGDVLSKDDKSLTIKLRDGGSKIIFFSDKTQVLKSVAGAMSDVNIGDPVVVNGANNQDGSINAEYIQIRPKMASTTPTSTPR